MSDFHHYKGSLRLTILCSMPTTELKAIPIFKDLDDSHLQLLSPIISKQSYGADTMIFELGEPADFLYILNQAKSWLNTNLLMARGSLSLALNPGVFLAGQLHLVILLILPVLIRLLPALFTGWMAANCSSCVP